MKVALTLGALIAVGVIAFLIGRQFGPGDGTPGPAWVDGSLIVSTPESDGSGFCRARVVRERMKGRAFVWVRRGECQPAEGGYFELRPKPGNTSPLQPLLPRGRDVISATALDAAEGTIFSYDLWQVLPDGTERKLHDPEIEIGPPM